MPDYSQPFRWIKPQVEVCRNLGVSSHTSTFALFHIHSNSVCPSNPQRWRNGQRCCMCLMYQFLTGPVIKSSIHVTFPLAEELQSVAASHPALNDIPRGIVCVLLRYFCQRHHIPTDYSPHVALHNFSLASNVGYPARLPVLQSRCTVRRCPARSGPPRPPGVPASPAPG